MATDPDGDVVAHLNTTIGALTTDTNLFASKQQAPVDGIPHLAVFVLPTGGPAPEAYVDGGSGSERRYSAVQVTSRSEPREYNAGKAFARVIRDALHHATIAGYLDVKVNETEPNYLGENDAGNHVWTSNLELFHEE